MRNKLKDLLNKHAADLSPELQKEFEALLATKGRDSAVMYLPNGKVGAIRCYFHRVWEPVVGPMRVEYGSKRSTSTGLNTMCKAGVRAWTKWNNRKQRFAVQFADGLITQEQYNSMLAETAGDNHGDAAEGTYFDTAEDCQKYLDEYYATSEAAEE